MSGGRDGDTIWLSCICGSYICSNAMGACEALCTLDHGWIQYVVTPRVKVSFFQRTERGTLVSPLKPCIYALLMGCDGERSWVCLHVFVNSLHVTVLIHACCRLDTVHGWAVWILMCFCETALGVHCIALQPYQEAHAAGTATLNYMQH